VDPAQTGRLALPNPRPLASNAYKLTLAADLELRGVNEFQTA